MAVTSYAIALGSNRRGRHGSPAETVRAAAAAIVAERLSRVRRRRRWGRRPRIRKRSRSWHRSGSARSLDELKQIERAFGRRAGRRWGPRVLDLDIILWSGGCWEGGGLVVPHPRFRERSFVLEPLAELAPSWRDPIGGGTVRQLLACLRRGRAVDPAPARP